MSDDLQMRRTAKGKRGTSCSGTRMTTINRVSVTQPIVQRGSTNVRMSMSSAPMMSGALVDNNQEVGKTLENRKKEKSDIQGLNKRLAGYIDNCRILEAQNKALMMQLENERKKKLFDPEELKELYGQEMDALKKCIEELTSEKAEFAPRIAKLEDQLLDAQDMNDKLESDMKDLIKKLELANNQIGNLTGEVTTLRNNNAIKDDQIKNLQDKIKRQEAEVLDQRANVEEECNKRIQAEMREMSECETLEFKVNCLEAEIEEYKNMLNSDKDDIDIKNLLQSQMSNCISELQKESDDRIDQIRAEFSAKYEAQVQALQNAGNRDSLERSKYESEIQRLKNKLGDATPKIGDLQMQIDQMRRQMAQLQEDLRDETQSHERDNMENNEKIESLIQSNDSLVKQLEILLNQKCDLELEIATYRKMMDVEDDHMKELFDKRTGSRSEGANMLNDMVQSS